MRSLVRILSAILTLFMAATAATSMEAKPKKPKPSPPPTPTTQTVDCANGETVADALANVQYDTTPANIIIDGTCREAVVVSRSDVSFFPAAPGDGLEAPDPDSRVLFVYQVQRIQAIDLTITGGAVGVNVGGGSSLAANRIRVEGATEGVHVREGSSANINNSVLSNCLINGLVVQLGGHVTVVSSEIEDNGFHGVFATGGTVDLRQTSIRNNDGAGVFAWTGAIVSIDGSSLANNAHDGLALQSNSTAQISGNRTTIAENAGNGIGVYTGSVAQVWNTDIEDNVSDGIRAGVGSVVDVTQNSLIRRNRHGIHLGDTSILSADSSVEITANDLRGINCQIGLPAVAQLAAGSNPNVHDNNTGEIVCNPQP
jgi:hypothetical protein